MLTSANCGPAARTGGWRPGGGAFEAARRTGGGGGGVWRRAGRQRGGGRWCPEGLTHTQKRKLQRLRSKEKREQEEEKTRDEYFNKYRPMLPQGKVWQVKTVDQPTEGPVELTPVTGQTGASDRSDRPEPPVRPVEPSAESTAESAVPVSVSRVDEVKPAPPAMKDKELVDYEASPERNNLEINVVHMSLDYLIIPEEEVAHLQFGPHDAVF